MGTTFRTIAARLHPPVAPAAQNPELGNVPYVHMLALLARAAARRGILIVLQAKILNLYSQDIGLWYSYGVSEDDVRS